MEIKHGRMSLNLQQLGLEQMKVWANFPHQSISGCTLVFEEAIFERYVSFRRNSFPAISDLTVEECPS